MRAGAPVRSRICTRPRWSGRSDVPASRSERAKTRSSSRAASRRARRGGAVHQRARRARDPNAASRPEPVARRVEVGEALAHARARRLHPVGEEAQRPAARAGERRARPPLARGDVAEAGGAQLGIPGGEGPPDREEDDGPAARRPAREVPRLAAPERRTTMERARPRRLPGVLPPAVEDARQPSGGEPELEPAHPEVDVERPALLERAADEAADAGERGAAIEAALVERRDLDEAGARQRLRLEEAVLPADVAAHAVASEAEDPGAAHHALPSGVLPERGGEAREAVARAAVVRL